MIFGTDGSGSYDESWVRGYAERDNVIYDKYGVSAEQREKIYHKNLMRFIKGGD
jgi:hypothetical protein